MDKVTKIEETIDVNDFREGEFRIIRSNKMMESRSDLTVIQYRVMKLLATQIKKGDTEFNMIDIPVSKVVPKGKGGSQYRQVKADVIALTGIMMQIKKEGKWESIPLIRAKGDDKTNTIRAKFIDDMKPYLLNLSGNYTSLLPSEMGDFNHSYSFKLYDMIIPQKSFKSNYVCDFNLDYLRFLTVTEKKHKRWRRYCEFILDVAVKEINDTTYIHVEYAPLLTIRSKVISVRFTVSPSKRGLDNTADSAQKNQNEASSNEEANISIVSERDVSEDVVDVPFTDIDYGIFSANDYHKYSQEYSKEFLDWYNEHVNKNSAKINNPMAWFVKGVQKPDGWLEKEFQEHLVKEAAKKTAKANKKKTVIELDALTKLNDLAKQEWEDILKNLLKGIDLPKNDEELAPYLEYYRPMPFTEERIKEWEQWKEKDPTPQSISSWIYWKYMTDNPKDYEDYFGTRQEPNKEKWIKDRVIQLFEERKAAL